MKVLVLAILLNAGCATTPADEAVEYERADARIKAFEQFHSLKTSCRASGGVLYIDESWGRFRPTLIDLRMARCVSPRELMPPLPYMRR